MKRFTAAVSIALVAAASARADFTVTGSFRYVDRVFSYGSGFTGSEPTLPIRLARVEVIDDMTGAMLASGATDEAGNVSIPVIAAGTANVIVRCFARSDAFGSNRLRVTTTSDTVYSVASAVFAGHDLGVSLDVGTITAQKVVAAGNQGGPFNMLDQLVAGIQYVKAQGAGNPSATIRMFWPAGGGSFASGNTAHMSDDDGFDDTVQLHELGHVLHDMFSDSDNPAGSHSFGESDQDPRLSVSEGWASFFAAAVRRHQGLPDPGVYMDCDGNGSTGIGSIQLRMRMETGTPFSGSTAGEADEGAVFCVLWDVIDDVATPDTSPITDDDPLDGTLAFAGVASPDEALWDVLVGPVNTASNLTIRNFWNGLFAPVDYGRHAELEDVFAGWEMRFFADVSEPDNSLAEAKALTPGDAWGSIRTLYWSAAAPPVPGDGDTDHVSFVLAAGTTFEVETRYPNGSSDAETYCDTRLTVFRPNGTQFATAEDGGMDRNAKLTGLVADASGTWTARVDTAHLYRRTGSYQLRARILALPPAGCEEPASATTFGAGKPGVNGTPTLTALAPPVIPSTFTVRIEHGPTFGLGLLFLGPTPIEVPFDGGALLVEPIAIPTLFVGPTGTLDLTATLADPAACGAVVHLQVMFPNDPGATGFHRTSQSNRLTLSLGG